MANSAKDHRLSKMKKNGAEKEEGKKRGFLIGCLGIILLIIGFGIFSMYMSTPQTFGDKDKIIEDIYRYHQRYGKWPQSLEELKSKLPDYKFQYRYSYMHNDEMFVVKYQGGGMMGDDHGEFYCSDTKEWKDIYSSRKEWKELEDSLLSPKYGRKCSRAVLRAPPRRWGTFPR